MRYRFGEFDLFPESYELRRRGERITLEPRVLEVLAYLVAHHDRVVPKGEMLGRFWADAVVSEHVLTRAIKEVRRAVGGPRRSWVRTVYGRGFQFVGPVTQVVEPGPPVVDLPRPRAVTAGRPVPSVAVLPFADLSPARDQGYFCEGLAEELIGALTRIEGLFVASRTSSFQFRSVGGDPWTIGERLNVATVLEGSVRKDRGRVRISVQLIDVADNGHLWSAVFERELRDVFALYWGGADAELATADEMSHRAVALAPDSAEAHAARALVLAVRGRSREASAAFEVALRLNPRVYKIHYAYARMCWVSGLVDKAVRHLEQAERLNPGYHGVPALLGKAYARLGRTEEA